MRPNLTITIPLLATVAFWAQPVRAQAPSDSERLEKLEKAVELLQQRNAQLEAEVKQLKKKSASSSASHPAASAAPAPPTEGPTKTVSSYDGKSYVEKSVPIEEATSTKWKLSTPITELELFGDIRLRYEYRAGQTADNALRTGLDDWIERERERYRIRFGLRGTLVDDWFFGIRLETSQNPRSTNLTFGDDTSGSATATNNEPFSKVSDGINVGQAYIGYRGFPDITLEAGRMPLTSVLVTTRMVWDDDINPEGASEQWKHTFSFGTKGDETTASYSKDSNNVVPTKQEPFMRLDLFANFAQLEYDDTAIEDPLGPRATTTVNGVTQKIPNTDAFLLAWQLGARANFPNNIYVQIAPTLYNYTGDGDTFNGHFQGGSPTVPNATSLAQNQTGINSLLVYDMPWEIGWKVAGFPMRVFGDFATNLEADDRARAAGHPGYGDQRYAYQAGLGIGQLKRKHDWLLEAYYQHTEQYALDPNLIDSDLFNQTLNLHGPVVRAGYMLTDAVWVSATWAYAWRINNALGTGGTGDIGINPIDQYQLFQLDLNLKF